jgi:small subunit ribosomal protein S6
MRPYEVMIIFDPTLEDDAVRAEVDRSTELIRSRGGNPGRVERWGKRRLAYEIRRQREGSYVVLEAQAEPATMADLSRALTLTDGVLRHKVIHLPEKAIGKPARALGTVGPDDGSSPPASPAPQPSPVAAE